MKKLGEKILPALSPPERTQPPSGLSNLHPSAICSAAFTPSAHPSPRSFKKKEKKGKNETFRVLSAKAYLIGPGPSPGHARLPQLRAPPSSPRFPGPSLNNCGPGSRRNSVAQPGQHLSTATTTYTVAHPPPRPPAGFSPLAPSKHTTSIYPQGLRDDRRDQRRRIQNKTINSVTLDTTRRRCYT